MCFNPSGSCIEAFSNPLWTLLLTAAQAVLPPVTAMKCLSIAVSLLLLVWLSMLSRKYGALWGLFLLVVTPSYAMWSVDGLETLQFALVIVYASLHLLEVTSPVIISLVVACLKFPTNH